MKKKKFWKKYGDLDLHLSGIALNTGLSFEGIIPTGKRILIHAFGDFNDYPDEMLRVDIKYSAVYIMEIFPKFQITAFIDDEPGICVYKPK